VSTLIWRLNVKLLQYNNSTFLIAFINHKLFFNQLTALICTKSIPESTLWLTNY